ncbi:MAG: hypothetical protein WAV90_05690 [Gordonia amarae]
MSASGLTELMAALDNLGVAVWFQALPAHERHWEHRSAEATGKLIDTLRARADIAGASAEQIADCFQYAKQLVLRKALPGSLFGRSFDQFASDMMGAR